MNANTNVFASTEAHELAREFAAFRLEADRALLKGIWNAPQQVAWILPNGSVVQKFPKNFTGQVRTVGFNEYAAAEAFDKEANACADPVRRAAIQKQGRIAHAQYFGHLRRAFRGANKVGNGLVVPTGARTLIVDDQPVPFPAKYVAASVRKDTDAKELVGYVIDETDIRRLCYMVSQVDGRVTRLELCKDYEHEYEENKPELDSGVFWTKYHYALWLAQGNVIAVPWRAAFGSHKGLIHDQALKDEGRYNARTKELIEKLRAGKLPSLRFEDPKPKKANGDLSADELRGQLDLSLRRNDELLKQMAELRAEVVGLKRDMKVTPSERQLIDDWHHQKANEGLTLPDEVLSAAFEDLNASTTQMGNFTVHVGKPNMTDDEFVDWVMGAMG